MKSVFVSLLAHNYSMQANVPDGPRSELKLSRTRPIPSQTLNTRWFATPLRITKFSQPSNLAQVTSLVKVATISRHQHRARNRQCNCVVQRVEQVVVKLARQFNGSGVGGGGPARVKVVVA